MKIIRSKFFKYAVTLLIFGIWIIFFDDYNLMEQRRMKDHLKTLREELKETKEAISKYEVETQMIENDLDFIEETGRNKYLIKHEDEDVYIFLKEDDNGELSPMEE